MSRRHFIKETGLLTGGLLFGQHILQAASRLQTTGEKINIAVIGCGDRGKGIMHVLKDLQDDFSVTAVCDVLDFRIKEAQAVQDNLKTFSDHRKLLDDKSIQAVVIAVPLSLHFMIASDALKAGKHVYLEKTMTYNIPQVMQLVNLARQYSKQTLQVGHQYRYTPLYHRVKEMIEKNYLGRITQIDCRWDRNANWRRPVPAGITDRQINWRMYREFSGGLPAELLSHQIDFINWAFGTHPDEIMATGGIDFYKDGRETNDNMQAVLRYKKAGMIGNFGATCANAHDGYLFKLKGSKGTVELLVSEGVYYPEKDTKKELETVDGVTGATKIVWNKDGGIPILKEPSKDGTWYSLQDFYQSVTKHAQPESNVITGGTTAICIHMINLSADTNTMQEWKPSYNLV